MASVDELWIVDFGGRYPGEPAAHRPALVIGPTETFGHDFPFVILLPLTSTRHALSLHVEVEPSADTGLRETSYVQCELIRSVNRRRLVRPIGTVGAEVSHQVSTVIRTLLGH